MEQQAQRRLFFALLPPKPLLERLVDLMAQINVVGARLQKVTNLHLTLHFLGAVPGGDLAHLIQAAERIVAAPFDLQLNSLGYWPKSRVIWAGCQARSAPLEQLAQELRFASASFGHARLEETFEPHITLAREAIRLSSQLQIQPYNWLVEQFHLFETVISPAGSDYKIRHTFALRG